MRFQVYYMHGPTLSYLRSKKEELVKLIGETSTLDENGLQYCLNNVDLEESVLSFTISQEYYSGLTTTNPDDKTDRPIEENPWDRTLCAIDTQTGRFLMQKKKYSPKNLNPPKTLHRVEDILRYMFMEHAGTTLELVSTVIGMNNEYFKELFLHSDSRGLQVKGLLGKKVPVGTPLHNPREEWDVAWAESWNQYDSELIDSIHVQGKPDRDIKKSPLTKLMLATDAEIKAVSYYDEEEHKVVNTTKRSAGTVFVNISKDEEVVTQQKTLVGRIQAVRNMLVRFGLDKS